MAVSSAAVSLVILPVAIVDVAVSMNESALSVRFVVSPVAFIHTAVGPDLDTLALSSLRAAKPLTLISCSIFENNHLAALTGPKLLLKCHVIIDECSQLLSHFLIKKSQIGHKRLTKEQNKIYYGPE